MEVRFWFQGNRATQIRPRSTQEAAEQIQQARANGIALVDPPNAPYGVPKLYFQFDLELTGCSESERQQIYDLLGSLQVK